MEEIGKALVSQAEESVTDTIVDCLKDKKVTGVLFLVFALYLIFTDKK